MLVLYFYDLLINNLIQMGKIIYILFYDQLIYYYRNLLEIVIFMDDMVFFISIVLLYPLCLLIVEVEECYGWIVQVIIFLFYLVC